MNLLERTRRLLKGLTPASPAKVQYYSVACSEGHRLRGERTEGYQALRCPTCGEGMFILPRSPLPEPIAPESTRETSSARGTTELREHEDEPIRLSDPVLASQVVDAGSGTKSASDLDVDGEIEWVDSGPESIPAAGRDEQETGRGGPEDDAHFFENLSVDEGGRSSTATVPGQRPQPSRAKPATGTDSSRSQGKTKGRQEPPTIAPAPRESIAEWARRRRHPLIFGAVILIVMATVGYRLWSSKFRDFPRIVEIGREEGLAALDAGDFDTAHQLLSEARRAVDALGGAVEGAEEIRHGAEEAALFTTRCPEPLEQILAEASADPNEWSTRFKTFYKGRSILLGAMIESTPDEGGAYDLDYRILPNGEGTTPSLRVGRIDLTGFLLFERTAPKKGDHVQFGARLASFSYDRESKEWVVGLEPDSGVFLTHPKALEATGRPSGDPLVGEELP